MQEIAPRAGRGGLGFFQWTGPRRVAFEAWLKRKGAKPDDLDASYAFLVRELRGPEKRAVAATRAASGLEAKVRAFEQAFERAGVKHYPSRVAWAQVALGIWQAQGGKVPKTTPAKPAGPPAAKPASKPEVVTVEPQTAPSTWWERLLGVRRPAARAGGRMVRARAPRHARRSIACAARTDSGRRPTRAVRRRGLSPASIERRSHRR